MSHFLKRCLLFTLLIISLLPVIHAQDATATPFVITASPGTATGHVVQNTNLWADPLIRRSTPVTSIATGQVVMLLGINPRGDRYRIEAYGDIYWINVDALEIIGESLNLPVIPEVEPTITPTLPVTSTPTPAPTFTLAPALFLPGEPTGYGAYITDMNNAATVGAMQEIGMDWVKVRIEYGEDSLSTAIRQIDRAHEAGFNILLTVVGDAEALTQGGDIYIAEFIDELATMAEFGADAIEVWEMANLAENWVPGSLSGADYTVRLLLPAYRTIKTRNPHTMVLNAAPKAVTFEDAEARSEDGNPIAIPDDTFMREFIRNRGHQYVDCIAMRYEEGMVRPDSTRNDVRDNYYTRYLGSMLSTYSEYQDSVSLRKPYCITSLGYITEEGLENTLPETYYWADEISLEDQAAWHSAARGQLTGRDTMALVIVNNMDFNDEATDPIAAAYSLIRPDGTCPTCDQLVEDAPARSSALPAPVRRHQYPRRGFHTVPSPGCSGTLYRAVSHLCH